METSSTAPRYGLVDIPRVPLDAHRQSLLDTVSKDLIGPRHFQPRRIAETRDLLALEQIAPPGRLRIEMLDLSFDLIARLRLRAPVACMLPGALQHIVAPEAVLLLRYFEEAVRLPQPGYRFFTILDPLGVWHPNVGFDPIRGQVLCVGPTIPASVRATELVLLAYEALCMRAANLSPTDPGGIINLEAAMYWRQCARDLPLSRVPFLGTDDLTERSLP
jgi:hypothetical protein